MPKSEIKTCPRCNNEFECESSRMLLCACNEVELSEQALDQLAEEYEDCLCLNCLHKIKNKGLLITIN